MQIRSYLAFSAVLVLGVFACGGGSDDEPMAEAMGEPALQPLEPRAPSSLDAPVNASSAEPAPVEPLPVPSGSGLEAPVVEDLAEPVVQLEWRNCGQFSERNFECAELEVPVDYAEPDGETVFIALRRIVANPNEPYRGALLFNPGGPGAEGIELSRSFFEQNLFEVVAPGFDIIGFDPRGVNQSGERGCGIPAPELYPGGGTPVDASLEAQIADLQQYSTGCAEQWGPLFQQLGSNNVARDMEEIRKALGQEKLNFYGASYGTRLGALYAHYFPATTGRIVLDAAVHPRASFVELLRGQFNQRMLLQEGFFLACESGGLMCPPEPRQVFQSALQNARARGLEFIFLINWILGLETGAGVVNAVNQLAAEAADPGGVWIQTALVAPMGPVDTSEDVAFNSVTCTDDVFEPPTLEQLAALRAEYEQVNPLFSFFADRALLCAGWRTTRDPVPLPTAVNASRLLVIGGTTDPRTPFAWSQALVETLGNATLLTSAHYGHVAIVQPGAAGDCSRTVVRAYLTTGSLPSFGAQCE